MIDQTIQSFISERYVTGVFRERLETLSTSDSSAVAQLVSQLQPSANFLRDVLDLAEEISARDGKAPHDILSEPGVREIILGELGRKDKQKRIRQYLESRRFPMRSKIAARLNMLQRVIQKNAGVRVEFPEDLEGDQLTCAISFRSADELSRVAEQLAGLKDATELKEMFSLLRGEHYTAEHAPTEAEKS